MKFPLYNYKKITITIITLLFIINWNLISSLNLTNREIQNTSDNPNSTQNSVFKIKGISSVQKYKFLFMLHWPTVRNDKIHPLNILSYKNVLLSSGQVVIFVSQNPSISVSNNYF